jgi:tetratricopeptide (TPR) repeat protein
VRPGPPWALIGAAMLLILPAAAASAADDRTTEAVAGKADEKAGATEAIRALLDRGEAAEALVRADRAIAADPRDVPVIFLRGVALMDLGRDAEALAHFERMTQDYPELPDPWNNIALLHVRAGQLELALPALERALRNDPSHRTARANLGLVHLMLAARAWETVAATGPVDALLKRRLEGVRALLTDDAR